MFSNEGNSLGKKRDFNAENLNRISFDSDAFKATLFLMAE